MVDFRLLDLRFAGPMDPDSLAAYEVRSFAFLLLGETDSAHVAEVDQFRPPAGTGIEEQPSNLMHWILLDKGSTTNRNLLKRVKRSQKARKF